VADTAKFRVSLDLWNLVDIVDRFLPRDAMRTAQRRIMLPKDVCLTSSLVRRVPVLCENR